MKRIDVILITLGLFLLGGLAYFFLGNTGLTPEKAGIWSQLVLILIVLGWTSTYFFRVSSKKMTYHQQIKDYEDAVIQKRFEELTPEELAKLQEEINQEKG